MAERPAVYFRLEMGVSWRPRWNQRHASHQMTLMSKSARERANDFPRHWPPQNTAYPGNGTQPQRPYFLQHSSYDHNGQPYTQQTWHHQQPAESYHPTGGWPHPARQPPAPAAQQATKYDPQPEWHPGHGQLPLEHQQLMNLGSWTQDQQRLSRPRSPTDPPRGRNRSAPPPMSGSSWNAEPEPMMATALPRGAGSAATSKPLPPTPAQFRLGHDDMPWSPSPFPMGRSDDGSNEQSPELNDIQMAATDGSSVPGRHVDDQTRGRTREMQSLATAMMTVDNGFEDQWWYQGERLVNIAGDLISPAEVAQRYAPGANKAVPSTTSGRGSLGAGSVDGQISARPSLADIVSPVSDLSSPTSGLWSPEPVKRSLTSRSEELFIR